MPDYMLLMHAPDSAAASQADWGPYLAGLQASGRLQGGSAIGQGQCVRKAGEAPPITAHLSGFVRISAGDMDEARALLVGNPVFEAGGVVEIRELPRSDSGAEEAAARPADRFENRRMNQPVFQTCGMAGAQFDDVNLGGASFNNVNLRGARLSDVNLSGVAIDNANIQGMTIFGRDIHALMHGRGEG